MFSLHLINIQNISFLQSHAACFLFCLMLFYFIYLFIIFCFMLMRAYMMDRCFRPVVIYLITRIILPETFSSSSRITMIILMLFLLINMVYSGNFIQI